LARGRGIKTAFLALSFLVRACLYAFPNPSDLESALSAFAQAQALYQAQDFEAAKRLLDISLEFRPDFSESLFLYARILLREQETTIQGMDALRRAIQNGSWSLTDPELAVAELGEAYVRTGGFESARLLLGTLSGKRREDPRLTLILARSLLGLKDRTAAERLLAEALRRFPGQASFYLLYAEVLRAGGRTAAARETLQRGQRQIPAAAELLLAQARLEEEGETRLFLLEEYFKRGGRDPGAANLALMADAGQPERYLDVFLQLGGERQVDALDQLRELISPLDNPFSRLSALIAAYSGERIVDEDRDGFYEEKYWYREGALERWRLDGDQDGLAEIEVLFQGEAPLSLEARGGEGDRLSFRYSRYPFLEKAAFKHGETRREYSLLPYKLELPLLAPPSFYAIRGSGGVPVRLPKLRRSLRPGLKLPAELEIQKLSYRAEEYLPSSDRPLRTYALLEGQTTRLEEDLNLDGKVEHTVAYDGGRPAAGGRDLNGDGRFEVAEEYKEGALARSAWDEDGDGKAEYVELKAREPERYWDYNADGIFDSRELGDGSGARVREFSSRLDGTFDLKAVFTAGSLVRFLRGGQELPVSFDAKAGVFWLGARSSLTGDLRSLPEGLQVIEGREFFLFRHQGNTYAEEMR